jgi:hypothetical protein
MTKPNGTALARVPEQVATEKVPEAETLVMPAVLLQAAELTCARDETAPGYMRGVYLHAVEGRGRIVATDGQRMFLASFAIEGKAPSWLKSGVVVSSQDLKTRLSLIQKIGGEPTVKFIFSKGNPTIELTDMRSTILLKVPVVSTSYPDYSKLLGAESFTDLDGDGDARVRDWQPIGINSQYLKKCGEIAKILESGLEKDARSKLGMVVRAFNSGAADAPMVFDFSTWPGAILVVAPAKMVNQQTAKETAQLLAPAAKATVAALRAHATRWQQRADATENEAEKAEATRKAAEFTARVANVLRNVPLPNSQIGTEAKPEPAAEAEAKPKAEAEPEPEGGPAVKRTRIRVNKSQDAAA